MLFFKIRCSDFNYSREKLQIIPIFEIKNKITQWRAIYLILICRLIVVCIIPFTQRMKKPAFTLQGKFLYLFNKFIPYPSPTI